MNQLPPTKCRTPSLAAFSLALVVAGVWLAGGGVLEAACGDETLDAGETCDDGDTVSGDGCSDACLIEAGWTCTAPVPPSPGSNVIADSSFEAGTPNPVWTEDSLNFGTPICDIDCFGTIPPVGAWYVWFGDGTDEVASVEQSVTIPGTATTLDFDLFVELCDSVDDFMRVLIDGNQEFRRECTPGSEDADFVGQSIDITAYADGAAHTLRLETSTFGTNEGISNFFVDSVVIGDNVKQPSQCFPLVGLSCNGPLIDFDTPLPGIPADWLVIDNSTSGVVWSDIPTARESGNYTGSGEAATASSDRFGQAAFDTELWSAPFDLSALSAATEVSVDFLANYQNFGGRDFLDLDISTDGGSIWTTLLSWNEDHPLGGLRTLPGEVVSVDLSSFVGLSGLIVRWRYYDPEPNEDWYAQIDEVGLTCRFGLIFKDGFESGDVTTWSSSSP